MLASGVEAIVPQIAGLDRTRVVMAEDVLLGKAKVGRNVLIIGGELVGCETADVLSGQGKSVTVTRRGNRMAARIMPILRRQLLTRLESRGVKLITGVKYESVTADGVVITDSQGVPQLIEADTIVLAAGSLPNDKLARQLEKAGFKVRKAGDCVRPAGIMEAVRDGFMVGRDL